MAFEKPADFLMIGDGITIPLLPIGLISLLILKVVHPMRGGDEAHLRIGHEGNYQKPYKVEPL